MFLRPSHVLSLAFAAFLWTAPALAPLPMDGISNDTLQTAPRTTNPAIVERGVSMDPDG